MNDTIAQLKNRFEQALVAAFGEELSGTDPILVAASNPKFGDFQSNVAMSLTKKLGKPPRAIAEAIVQNLEVSEICQAASIAGPGFINLSLKSGYLEAQLKAIQSDPRLGIEPTPHPQRVIVDYPSPNIAKEMHVGHLRPSVIGDCIARILEFIGHEVLRLSHIGDWGTPFGMLIAYLQAAYPTALQTTEGLDLGDLASFYRAAKQRFDQDRAFQEAARQAVVKLQAGDEPTLQAWKIVCDLSNRTNRQIYDLMGLSDKIQERGESFYNPFLPKVLEELDDLGLLVEDEGAKCVFLDGFTNKEGNPLPLIVQKSDGGYNYAATDLAAIRYRMDVDRAQRVVYPVGREQTNHFIQIFQVGKKAGWITSDHEFIHLPLGLILGEDGKKLKSRSGDAPRMVDLLKEAIDYARTDLETRLREDARQESPEFIEHVAQVVGISAIKYADLSQSLTSNYIFNLDRMLALQGNTIPYMLYAYARVQSISREGGIDFQQLGADTQIVLQAEEELVLAKHLLQLDEILTAIETDLFPHRLCEYLFELSQKFNRFYERCPILQAEDPQRTSRLILADLTARTIKLGLSLLGIPVLERM